MSSERLSGAGWIVEPLQLRLISQSNGNLIDNSTIFDAQTLAARVAEQLERGLFISSC
jgi:hypothetical protein